MKKSNGFPIIWTILATCVATIIFWLWKFPIQQSIDWPSLLTTSLYLALFGLSYLFLIRMRIPIMELGAGMIAYSLLIELLMRITLGNPIFEVFLAGSRFIGILMIVMSLFSSQRLFQREFKRTKRAERALQERNNELAVLHHAGQALTSTLDLESVLETILEEVRRLLGVAACSVWLIDEESGELVCRQASASERHILKGWHIPLGSGIVGITAQLGQSQVISDARIDDRHFKEVDKQVGLEIRSILGVPLQVKDKTIGVLEVVDATVDRFREPELALVEPLAATAAIAIENARLYQETDRLRAFNENIVQGVSEGILIYNTKGQITFVNSRLLEMLGYTLKELINQQWTVILPPGSVPISSPESNGIIRRNEAILLTRKGRHVPVLISDRPLYKEGGLTGTLSVFTDITDRVEMEQALKKSEEKYRKTLDSMHDWIHVIDTDQRIVLFNESLLRVNEELGLETDVSGRFLSEIFNFLPQNVFDEYRSVIESGEVLTSEESITTKERKIETKTIKIPVLEQNQVKWIVTVIKDVTETKKAEVALRQAKIVVENSPTVLFRCKATRGLPIEFVSDNVAQFGYTVEQLVNDHIPFCSLIHPDDAEKVTHDIEESIKNRKDRFQHEYRFLSRDGKIKWVDVRTAVERDESGNPSHFQGVVIDISERHSLQRQLEQQERLAAVGQLASGIAHDFNNILASVILYADILLRAPGISQEYKKHIRTIRQQGSHAADLIQQILDFSRKAVIEPQHLDLAPFIQDLQRLLRRTLPENIRLHLGHDGKAFVVNVDPTRMQQVIMNLALNARDAMPAGGDLYIELAQLDIGPNDRPPLHSMSAGPWINLKMSDTGFGIPPEILPHIFEPFFTTKEVGKGTGLGLAQVYGIIKQHGGHIDVSSQVGTGTTIAIYLAPPPEYHANNPMQMDKESKAGHREVILLVEDEPTTLEAFADVLSSLNYKILAAENGKQALSLFRQHHPNISLVLSDLVMPEMGGKMLFREIRRIRPDIKIVALTGYPIDGELDDVRAAGVDHWLHKPVNLDKLAQIVAEILAE